MNNMNKQNSANNDMDLSEILYLIKAKKWVLVFFSLMAFSVVALYSARLPLQYRSNALLQIENKAGYGQASLGVQQMFLGGLGNNDSSMTQIALIKSRFILEPVVEKTGLSIMLTSRPVTLMQRLFPHKKKLPIVVQFDVPRVQLNKNFLLKILPSHEGVLYDSKKKEVLRGPLGKRLVSQDGKIKFKVESNADVEGEYSLSKRSTQRAIESLLSGLMIEEAGSKMRQNTGILDVSLRGTNPSKVVQILNTIAEVTCAKDAEKKAQEAAQTLKFLYGQLPIAKKSLQEAEKSLNQYRAKSGKIDIKLQTQFLLNELSDLARKRSELQVKKFEALQQYTSAHPLMVALDEQIRVLTLQDQKLLQNLKTLPASDQVAVNLMRDVKVKQSLYVVLLKKIQELQVIKAGTVSSVRILAYAKIPDAPIPNRVMLKYLSGLVSGFILGVGYIFSRRLISPKIRDPHWAERTHNVPNLSIVPYFEDKTILSSTKKSAVLVAYVQPRSLTTESIRSLRTSLQVTLSCASNNIVSILGISPGVGKSFISTNLAYLIAAGGKRVLIIDGDLRKGTVHKYFNESPSPGLTEVLTSQVALEKAWRPTTIHENLFVLFRGDYPTEPSELLMSHQFKETMAMVSKAFDVVIVDTAPILLVTDGMLMAHYSATNYLVMAADTHTPAEFELSLRTLAGSNVQLHGTIFNFHREIAKNNYYYYGKYYYNHNYYYEETPKSSVKKSVKNLDLVN